MCWSVVGCVGVTARNKPKICLRGGVTDNGTMSSVFTCIFHVQVCLMAIVMEDTSVGVIIITVFYK